MEERHIIFFADSQKNVPVHKKISLVISHNSVRTVVHNHQIAAKIIVYIDY